MSISQLLVLLQLALSLVVAAQKPGVPSALRDQAINIANTAISVATETVKNQTPAISQPVQATTTYESSMHALAIIGDANPISMVPAPTPTLTPVCEKDYGNQTLSDNDHDQLVYWEQLGTDGTHYNWIIAPQSFSAIQSNDKVVIDIPAKMLNRKGYAMSYKINYGINDVPNTAIGLVSTESNSLPITLQIPQEYFGHKVAFQLFINYDCAKYIGVSWLKPENNVVIIDLK